jgi:hypothetical protein
VADHLITPKNSALILIDYQPPQADEQHTLEALGKKLGKRSEDNYNQR